MKNEVKHTAHSSYRCEYHLVFAPKYRRKIIYKELRRDIIEIIKKLCKEMKVEIIEGEACPDHIHLLVSIPPYMSIAQFVGTLKRKSALMIFDRHANLKYKYGNRNFWCRGYFVDTVGKNENWMSATWCSRAQTSIIAELSAGNLPITRKRRQLFWWGCSMKLLVRIRGQRSLDKSLYEKPPAFLQAVS